MGAGGKQTRLSRAGLMARVLDAPAPIVAIETPAGMGKSWLLAELGDVPGLRPWDITPGAGGAPLEEPGPWGAAGHRQAA
jgi:hypothetical protein